MDIAYVVVVSISAVMIVAGTILMIISCNRRPPIQEPIEWKNNLNLVNNEVLKTTPCR